MFHVYLLSTQVKSRQIFEIKISKNSEAPVVETIVTQWEFFSTIFQLLPIRLP